MFVFIYVDIMAIGDPKDISDAGGTTNLNLVIYTHAHRG